SRPREKTSAAVPPAFDDALPAGEVRRHRDLGIPDDGEQLRDPAGLRRVELDDEPSADGEPARRLLEEPHQDVEPIGTTAHGFAGLVVADLRLELAPLVVGDVRRVRDDDVYRPAE